MGEVTPTPIGIRTVDFTCPICGGNMDFELSESVSDIGLRFRCNKCKKRVWITNYE